MADELKLSNQLCFPVYFLSKEITNRYRPLLEKLDLTYPQYLVLMVLWEHKKLNVRKIGELLHLDSGTLTPLLKRLEVKDIVKRERSKEDERIVEISLTDKAIALKENAACVPKELLDQVQLTSEEIEQLKKIVNKIINSIEK